jgi:hypothetical protein
LSPVPLASETLSDMGRNISRKVIIALSLRFALEILRSYLINLQVIVMSLSVIESSFVMHTTKSIQGFDHPEYPVIRVALDILDAREGYLWVRGFISLLKDGHLN